MTGNRSLDEFLPGGDDTDGTAPPERTDDEGEADAVEPIVPTCDWSPGGAPCGACGAVVEERWRDGDDLVCGDCKAW